MPEDSELLRQIGRGEQAAFRRLVERHAPYLYGVAHALVSNAADAEDLVQETFAAVITARFRGESSVRTWLVGILVKRAAMLRRSKRRRGSAIPLQLDTIDDGQAGTEASPELAGAEARMDLATMLAALSPDHREILVLRELEGLSYEQMARTLGLPAGTVESRLHRAREELRRRFAGYFRE